MRFNIADSHVSALLLAGRIGDATEVAKRVEQQAADLPGAAQLLGAAVAGRAALGAGDLHSACALLEQAAVGMSRTHASGWGYRYHIPRATALAISGSINEAAAALAALDNVRRPFRSLDYELSLARAWVSAGQGAVSEAITVLLSAAQRASAAGQFAAEVLCLQTATQFGDYSGAPRLRELVGMVEGLPGWRGRAVRRGPARRRCRPISVSVGRVRTSGRPCCRRRCGRPRRPGVSPERSSGIGVGLLHTRRGSGRAMRRQYFGAPSGRRALTADGSGTRDRDADRARTVQSQHRRATHAFGTHRRKPRVSGDVEDRHYQPRRIGRSAASPECANVMNAP